MVSEDLLKAVKSIGISLSYLIKENEFSIVDEIAHSTTKEELIEKLYNALRTLLTAAYNREISENDVKYLESAINNITELLSDDPSEVSYIAKLIGLYAIARGIKNLSKQE